MTTSLDPALAVLTSAGAALPADTLTRFVFFTGKGGVGKTSVASATALRLADAGRRTLLVSTDPASNLDDVFAMRAGTTATAVPGIDRLAIMNLDPEQAAAAYRERTVGPYRGVLPEAAVRSMEEQLSGACTVEIAAFNEFTALLADESLIAAFEHVVFDTAPTGHTLRLLSLPSAWSGYIESNTTGTSCLGPLAGLEGHRAQYADAVSALADAARTTVVLVSRPQASALREAARAGVELAALGIGNLRLVVNGVMADDGDDAIGRAWMTHQASALATMPGTLASLPRQVVPLASWDLTGIAALRAFATGTVPHGVAVDAPGATSPALPDLAALIRELGATGHGVVMTMGKGGVGKTTIAVAIALGLARAGHQVHLTTTDPAAHVDSALADASDGTLPPTLTVSRIDPDGETARYSAEVLVAAGALDPSERALLEEDLRSPCTEEIAVFRAFARVVDGAQGAYVVLDTAPTGHTLLLLDAAESYHREVARSSGSHVPQAVRALLPRLRDSSYTRMLLVTLAESTPVQEAARLQDDLRRAGIAPYGWVINASLAASGTTHPLLAARARLEMPRIAEVSERLATRTWLVPWRATPLG